MKKRKKILAAVFLIVSVSIYLSACGSAQEAFEDIEADIRSGITSDETNQTPTPEPTIPPDAIGPISDTCPSLSAGPPVGLACLHCAAPTARAQVLTLADIMARACRENTATTILLDGTFNDDLEQVKLLIDTITQHGTRLHMYIYLSNGPWQRRNDTPPLGVGTHLSGSEWDWQIQSNFVLREQYRQNIYRITPVLQHILDRGGVIYIIPGLEDNLSFDGARAVEELTIQTIPNTMPYAMGRNPCCGADTSLAPGHFRDIHNMDAPAPQNGLFTNDGDDRRLEEYPFFIAKAGQANASFVLWTREYQGIAPGNVFPHPDDRFYATPNATEQDALVSTIK